MSDAAGRASARQSDVPTRMEAAEALELSVYFGERARAGRKLIADELLDLYGRRGVRLSILMRGAQGFGAKHRLRTDRLLTLSEDLPVAAIAVDRRDRIEALLEDVGQLLGEGLVTLERAQLLGDEPFTGAVAPKGDALKLSVYIGRHERVGNRPAFVAACQLLYDLGVAGASVLLGVDGTRHGRRERARFFARNERVPLVIVAVGDGSELVRGIFELRHMLPGAVLTVGRVRVCKRDGQLLRPPHSQQEAAAHGTPVLQRLTVVTSEAATREGKPVHLELVRRLRATRLAGATSLRGVWGFHGDHRPHGDRLLTIRRHVPIVTTAIDSPAQIAQAFAVADELTAERGLVTSELVPADRPR